MSLYLFVNRYLFKLLINVPIPIHILMQSKLFKQVNIVHIYYFVADEATRALGRATLRELERLPTNKENRKRRIPGRKINTTNGSAVKFRAEKPMLITLRISFTPQKSAMMRLLLLYYEVKITLNPLKN